MATTRAVFHKYSADELMEAVDVFNVSTSAQAKIRAILDAEEKVPDAGNFFRYYNDRSKTVQFEKEFAAKVDSMYVLAVSTGIGALIAALVAAEMVGRSNFHYYKVPGGDHDSPLWNPKVFRPS